MKSLALLATTFALLIASAMAQFESLSQYYVPGYVEVPDSSDLSPPYITVEAWFYMDPAAPGGSSYGTIVRRHPSANIYILRIGGGNGGPMEWIIQVGLAASTTVTSPNVVPLNSWHHVAATYDGSMSRLYLDGVLQAQQAVSGVLHTAPSPMRIKYGNNGNENFSGQPDEVRVWSYARSETQIQSTMNRRIDHYQGLVAAWHFDGDYSDTTGGHDGSPVGYAELVSPGAPIASAALDGPQAAYIGSELSYDVRTSAPFVPYIFDVSVSGSSPGFALTNLPASLPLNEPLVNLQFGPSPFLSDFVGTTNAMGRASPRIQIPPAPFLVGVSVNAAFVSLDPSSPFDVDLLSDGVQTTIYDFEPVPQQVTPSTSPTSGGALLTITGLHFASGAAVRVNGIPATNVSVVSASTITCQSPAGVIGTTSVEVVNPDGGRGILAGSFAYVENLVLSSSTLTGAGPGDVATVFGAGFQIGLTVTVGGVPAQVIAVSSNSLSFAVNSILACNTLATVTNPDGQSGSIFVNAAPLISFVLFPSGPASGGNLVFIVGSGLDPASSVSFGGVPAVMANGTPEALLVVVPAGQPGSALLLVVSPGGCSAVSSYLYL